MTLRACVIFFVLFVGTRTKTALGQAMLSGFAFNADIGSCEGKCGEEYCVEECELSNNATMEYCACSSGCEAQSDCCTDRATFCGVDLNGCDRDVLGNGRCDTAQNRMECGWDGGDCCADTCEPRLDNHCALTLPHQVPQCYDPYSNHSVDIYGGVCGGVSMYLGANHEKYYARTATPRQTECCDMCFDDTTCLSFTWGKTVENDELFYCQMYSTSASENGESDDLVPGGGLTVDVPARTQPPATPETDDEPTPTSSKKEDATPWTEIAVGGVISLPLLLVCCAIFLCLVVVILLKYKKNTWIREVNRKKRAKNLAREVRRGTYPQPQESDERCPSCKRKIPKSESACKNCLTKKPKTDSPKAALTLSRSAGIDPSVSNTPTNVTGTQTPLTDPHYSPTHRQATGAAAAAAARPYETPAEHTQSSLSRSHGAYDMPNDVTQRSTAALQSPAVFGHLGAPAGSAYRYSPNSSIASPQSMTPASSAFNYSYATSSPTPLSSPGDLSSPQYTPQTSAYMTHSRTNTWDGASNGTRAQTMTPQYKNLGVNLCTGESRTTLPVGTPSMNYDAGSGGANTFLPAAPDFAAPAPGHYRSTSANLQTGGGDTMGFVPSDHHRSTSPNLQAGGGDTPGFVPSDHHRSTSPNLQAGGGDTMGFVPSDHHRSTSPNLQAGGGDTPGFVPSDHHRSTSPNLQAGGGDTMGFVPSGHHRSPSANSQAGGGDTVGFVPSASSDQYYP